MYFEVAWAGIGQPWSVREYTSNGFDGIWYLRTDLWTAGRDSTIASLRKRYPGCKIRVTR